MANVYAWPPVGLRGWEWTEEAPVSVSRSMQTGREYVSAAQRKRKVARLEVSPLAEGRSGAGYVEVLKRLLDGGVHLVRLNSTPINWWLDGLPGRDVRGQQTLQWFTPPDPLAWTAGGDSLIWSSGGALQGEAATDYGFPAVIVTGLPPNTLVARPGEFLTFNSDTHGNARSMVLRETSSDATGRAVIRLVTPVSGTGYVLIGTAESAVFRAQSMPRAMQDLGSGWGYSWDFREVFADEVGGFVEIDPWN